jgi:hypothetical protein
MQLEKVTVTLRRDPDREAKYQRAEVIKRHVTRCKNEEGMFERLQQDLIYISQRFGL